MAVNPWRTFARNHPKAAKWVWQIGVFYLFSLAVTVLQYALFTFLPYLFWRGAGLHGIHVAAYSDIVRRHRLLVECAWL